MKRIWLVALLMAVLSVVAEADGACPQGWRGTVPKPFDRGIRLVSELGRVDYGRAAQLVFAAREWISRQDWTGASEPSPVQVALAAARGDAPECGGGALR